MELHLALWEKAKAFRADPESRNPSPTPRSPTWPGPLSTTGRSYQQLLTDPSAFETYNIDTARTKGHGFARIQRYALEHLIGAR